MTGPAPSWCSLRCAAGRVHGTDRRPPAGNRHLARGRRKAQDETEEGTGDGARTGPWTGPKTAPWPTLLSIAEVSGATGATPPGRAREMWAGTRLPGRGRGAYLRADRRARHRGTYLLPQCAGPGMGFGAHPGGAPAGARCRPNCAVGADGATDACEMSREASRGPVEGYFRSRGVRNCGRYGRRALAAAVREQLRCSRESLTERTVPRKRKRPIAGDGGCTSDRASRTVTRDRQFANSISGIRTGIYLPIGRVVTGVTYRSTETITLSSG